MTPDAREALRQRSIAEHITAGGKCKHVKQECKCGVVFYWACLGAEMCGACGRASLAMELARCLAFSAEGARVAANSIYEAVWDTRATSDARDVRDARDAALI